MATSSRSIWLVIGAGILGVGGMCLAVGRGTSIVAVDPATIEAVRGPTVLSLSRGAVAAPARQPLSVTVRGTVAAPPPCLVAGVHVSILPEAGDEALVRVTCDAEGAFVASGVPALVGLRVQVRGLALEPRTVSLDDHLIPIADDAWELSAIAMTVRAPLPLVVSVDAWAMQQLAAQGVTAVRAAVLVPPPAARFREPDRTEWLEMPLRPDRKRRLTLDTVDPVTVRWSIVAGLPRVLQILETSVCRFDPSVEGFEPAVLTLTSDRLIVGTTVDTEGSPLAGCDVTVVANEWRAEVRSDASGRFVIVPPADILGGSIAARFGGNFHAGPVALVPGQPATLRVDTSRAASLRILAPDGSVPRWCGASVSNRSRRPLDPTDGLVETVAGRLVLKRETMTPGTWLYVYGPDFEGTVRLTEGLTSTSSPLLVRVVDDLTSELEVSTPIALAERMWVRLVEVYDGREPGRIRRRYSSSGEPGQVRWRFDRIAAAVYDGELRDGSGALLGRFRTAVFGAGHSVVVGDAPR